MRSRAQFKGHPIHPALIPYPFAFLTGTLLFDVLGLVRGHAGFHTTAAYLTVGGVIAGLLAAVPGLIDFIYTVPPKSSGKKRAMTHGLLNVTALALFSIAWMFRSSDWTPSSLTLIAELLGTGALSYAGVLGGTLVIRNMASVDHRYAGAGKWNDVSVTRRHREPVVVGHVDDLKDDQMKLVRINGRRYALAKTNGSYSLIDDSCTHRGGSLAGGVVIGGVVQCLWHGSQFDVKTGNVACGPAKRKIGVYEVKEEKTGRLVVAELS